MRWSAALIAATLALTVPQVPVYGARDGGPPSTKLAQSPYELLVFEVDNCAYCELLRRDALPLFRESDAGRNVPIRFVNVSHADYGKLKLASAITIAPTVVMMLNGQEIDRMTGYMGHDTFVKYVSYMMGRGD